MDWLNSSYQEKAKELCRRSHIKLVGTKPKSAKCVLCRRLFVCGDRIYISSKWASVWQNGIHCAHYRCAIETVIKAAFR